MVRQWIDELRTRPEFRDLDLRTKMLTEFIRNQEKKFRAARCFAEELDEFEYEGDHDVEFVFVDKFPSKPSSTRQKRSICQYYDLLHLVLAPQNADMSPKFTLVSDRLSPQSQLCSSSGSEISSPPSSLMRDEHCSSASSRISPEIESSTSIVVEGTSRTTSTIVAIDPHSRRRAVHTPSLTSTSAIDITLPSSPHMTILPLSTSPAYTPIQVNPQPETILQTPLVRSREPISPASPNVFSPSIGFVRLFSSTQNTRTPPDSPRYYELAEEFEMLDVANDDNDFSATVDGLAEPLTVSTSVFHATAAQAKSSALIIPANIDRQKYARDRARKVEIETTLQQARETVIHQTLRSACVDFLSQCRPGNDLAGQFEQRSGPISTPELQHIQNLVVFGPNNAMTKADMDSPDLPLSKSDSASSVWNNSRQNHTSVRKLHSMALTTTKLCRSRLRLLQRLRSISEGTKQSSSLRRRRCLEQTDSKNALVTWYLENSAHPYPSKTEKLRLAKESGLTAKEVNKWFLNARCRVKRGILCSWIF